MPLQAKWCLLFGVSGQKFVHIFGFVHFFISVFITLRLWEQGASVVSTVTVQRSSLQTNRDSNSGRSKIFFSPTELTDQLWGPPRFLFEVYQSPFSGVKRPKREVNQPPHPGKRLRMSGASSPLSHTPSSYTPLFREKYKFRNPSFCDLLQLPVILRHFSYIQVFIQHLVLEHPV